MEIDFIERIKNLAFPKLNISAIENIECKLKVKFSSDFIEFAKVSDFQYFSFYAINNLYQETDSSAIGETLRLREVCHLPLDTLMLSEDDASILLMKCCGDHEEIYWIAVEDFERYCEGQKLEYNPTIFPTFTDFFEFLLDEEEKLRGVGNNM